MRSICVQVVAAKMDVGRLWFLIPGGQLKKQQTGTVSVPSQPFLGGHVNLKLLISIMETGQIWPPSSLLQREKPSVKPQSSLSMSHISSFSIKFPHPASIENNETWGCCKLLQRAGGCLCQLICIHTRGRLKQSKVMLFMRIGKSISACMSTKSAIVPLTDSRGRRFHNGIQIKISTVATAINLGRRTGSRKVCS